MAGFLRWSRSKERSSRLVEDGEVAVRLREFEENSSGMADDDGRLAEKAIAQSLDGEVPPGLGQAEHFKSAGEIVSQQRNLEVSGICQKFFAGEFGEAKSVFKFADPFLSGASVVVEVEDFFGGPLFREVGEDRMIFDGRFKEFKLPGDSAGHDETERGQVFGVKRSMDGFCQGEGIFSAMNDFPVFLRNVGDGGYYGNIQICADGETDAAIDTGLNHFFLIGGGVGSEA